MLICSVPCLCFIRYKVKHNRIKIVATSSATELTDAQPVVKTEAITTNNDEIHVLGTHQSSGNRINTSRPLKADLISQNVNTENVNDEQLLEPKDQAESHRSDVIIGLGSNDAATCEERSLSGDYESRDSHNPSAFPAIVIESEHFND